MSLARETEKSQERSLLSHLLEILWHSALLTILLLAADYFFRPRAFALEDVLITFIPCVVGFSIITFFGLLLTGSKYRKPSKGGRG